MAAPSSLHAFTATPASTGWAVLLLCCVFGVVGALTLTVDGQRCEWDITGRFVMPGDTVTLAADRDGQVGWAATGGGIVRTESSVAWIAPDRSGTCVLTATFGDELKTINAFVMVPAESVRGGRLNGYNIGRYPDSSHFPAFSAPEGYVEVTPDNIDTPVSPRHTLREFVSRQSYQWPRYLVLREDLIQKLELLTDLVLANGHPVERLVVFSGFRTSAVQRRRGSPHSAHMYGGAADVYVDADNDGRMDDLNGDGAVNSGDARLLASYAEQVEAEHPELVGGIGSYRSSRHLGPFIQVDTRGERIRWHR